MNVEVVDYDASKHEAFVMNSWMNSWAVGRTYTERHVPMDRALAGHRRFVEAALASCGAKVAVIADDPDIFVGWACAEAVDPDVGCLHFMFVKKKFRGCGVARTLLASVGVQLTLTSATSRTARAIAEKLGLGFAPGLLYYPKVES